MFDLFKSQHQRELDANKTKITNLNYDCMYIIFEQLNLIDLLSVAEIKNDMHSVAANLFRQRYRQKRFVFILDYAKNVAEMYEESDFLVIYDKAIAFNLMKKFGNLVSRMDMAVFPYKPESY